MARPLFQDEKSCVKCCQLNSDQPAYLCNLISVFAVSMRLLVILGFPVNSHHWLLSN